MSVEVVFVAICLISYAFYKWATINNDYFKKRNIKFKKPHFFVGNTGGKFSNKYNAADFSQILYQSFPDESVYGFFDLREPKYVVRDPAAIKRITVKDFDYFEDHNAFVDDKTDRLWGNTIIFLKGEKWRQIRATLSPIYTISKMRQMFELITECTDDIVKHFSKQIENGQQVNVEMKGFCSRYANDIFATCAFGLKMNSFADPENEFYVNGQEFFNFTGVKTLLRLILVNKLPALARMLKITFSNRSISNTFRHTILDTMQIRKENNIHRPDMMNILMQIRDGKLNHKFEDEKSNENDGFAAVEESEIGRMTVNRILDDDEIVGQCFSLFLGAFETSSTNLTFTSYELMVNPDIQQKLYDEIVETNVALGGKRLTYDALQRMKYMDQVVCESLRKWPPAIRTDRVCSKDYVYDDGEMKFLVEKGKIIFFPLYGLHHDPKYFPEPDKFDPERFSDENKGNIVPGSYIPFGIGPRNCIGSRFALVKVKAFLYSLLLNFSIEANEKTEIPLKLKKTALTLVAENGMHMELKLRKRK